MKYVYVPLNWINIGGLAAKSEGRVLAMSKVFLSHEEMLCAFLAGEYNLSWYARLADAISRSTAEFLLGDADLTRIQQQMKLMTGVAPKMEWNHFIEVGPEQSQRHLAGLGLPEAMTRHILQDQTRRYEAIKLVRDITPAPVFTARAISRRGKRFGSIEHNAPTPESSIRNVSESSHAPVTKDKE